MSRVLPAEEIFHVQRTARARIEGANALVDLGAERVEFFDVREQLATDLFLVGIRQLSDLSYGLFERFDHLAILPRRAGPGNWSGRRESNPRMQLGKLPFYH